jgi:hypothetical protein
MRRSIFVIDETGFPARQAQQTRGNDRKNAPLFGLSFSSGTGFSLCSAAEKTTG